MRRCDLPADSGCELTQNFSFGGDLARPNDCELAALAELRLHFDATPVSRDELLHQPKPHSVPGVPFRRCSELKKVPKHGWIDTSSFIPYHDLNVVRSAFHCDGDPCPP